MLQTERGTSVRVKGGVGGFQEPHELEGRGDLHKLGDFEGRMGVSLGRGPWIRGFDGCGHRFLSRFTDLSYVANPSRPPKGVSGGQTGCVS